MRMVEIIRKMKGLKNKEAIVISEDEERAIFESKLKKDAVLVLTRKSKTFGILEVRVGWRTYYMIRDDSTGSLFLIRDDSGELKEIVDDVVEKIRNKLEEKYQTEFSPPDFDKDNLVFTDLTEGEDEEYQEIYSAVEIDSDIIPVKVLRGKESGKIEVIINKDDLAQLIMPRLKENYNFVRQKTLFLRTGMRRESFI